MTVLVPWPDLVLPDGVRAVTPESANESDLDDTTVYVPRFEFGPGPLELIARLPAVRVVQTLTAGYDHLLGFVPEDVTLCSGRGIHDDSVAEMALALTLAALRSLPFFVTEATDRRWSFRYTEALADRRVAVLGMGAIGSAVARRLGPFGCEIVGIGRCEREQMLLLLADADVLIICLPLDGSTSRLIDKAALAALPDGALVVNVSRGGVIETESLARELESGRLSAAVDVVEGEPLRAEDPLWRVPNLLITPHVAGSSAAFEPRARRLVTEQVRRWVAGDPLLNVVQRQPLQQDSSGRP